MSLEKIIFLASGNGGTLKFLFYAIDILDLNDEFEISMIIADRDCGSTRFAEKVGIRSLVLNDNIKSNISLYNQIALKEKPDIVITTIHKILDKRIISIPEIKFINLHYSMLPAFAGMIGMKTVDAAKNKNVKFIGSSTHLVTDMVDQGLVLYQSSYPVDWDRYNKEDIKQLVFESACLCLLNSLLFQKDHLFDQYKGVAYNPPLSFNPGVFDDKFWRFVKKS